MEEKALRTLQDYLTLVVFSLSHFDLLRPLFPSLDLVSACFYYGMFWS